MQNYQFIRVAPQKVGAVLANTLVIAIPSTRGFQIAVTSDGSCAVTRNTLDQEVDGSLKRVPHQAHGLGRTWPWSDVRDPGREAYRHATENITIEIRWCPAHKGAPGHEKANERAKPAAEEPTREGWNGCDIRIGTVRGQCPYPGLLHTSGGRSRGRSEPKPSAGLQDESPVRSISCQPSSDQMERWLAAPRGLPLGSIS